MSAKYFYKEKQEGYHEQTTKFMGFDSNNMQIFKTFIFRNEEGEKSFQCQVRRFSGLNDIKEKFGEAITEDDFETIIENRVKITFEN